MTATVTRPPVSENLLKALVTERRWVYGAFRVQFELAAQQLADEEHDPRLRTLTVAERTFRRWLAGGTKTLPQPDVCRVLERLFARPVAELFNVPAAARPARTPNTALVAFMDKAGCSNSGLAKRVADLGATRGLHLATDHVTVKKWREGAIPRPETVALICEVLSNLSGQQVTPERIGMHTPAHATTIPAGPGGAGCFAHRADLPDQDITDALERAERFVDLAVEDPAAWYDAIPGLIETLIEAAENGVRVRVALPDPAAHTATAAARARYGEVLFAPLATRRGVRLTHHQGVVNEVVRADDELWVTSRIDGVPLAACPVVALHRGPGRPLASAYLTGLEHVFATAVPYSAPAALRAVA